MDQLEGRTAVVSGAASGIGLAIVQSFVAEGMRVVMVDINADGLKTEAARLRERGAEVHSVQADVADPEAVDHVARIAVERFGNLHVAVNNAGIFTGGNSWELPLEQWHRVINV